MPFVVQCKYPYRPPNGNEGAGQLTLERGDLLVVDESVPDSKWVHGRRIGDGAEGWFPKNYCKDVEASEAERILSEAALVAKCSVPDESLANVVAPDPGCRETDASKVSEDDPEAATDFRRGTRHSSRVPPERERQPGAGDQYWRYRCADLQTELDALREHHERYRQEMTEALAFEMQRREYAESKLRQLCCRFESTDVLDLQRENHSSALAPNTTRPSPARSSMNDPLASPEFVSKLSVRERQRLFMERITAMHQRSS